MVVNEKIQPILSFYEFLSLPKAEFNTVQPWSVWLDRVEKRKISYFGLARNLSRHLISPNQDDLSYSARTFISG